MVENQIPIGPNKGGAQFATTHWTVVLAAVERSSPQASDALGKLCQTYWYPLYAFVRRQGYTADDAQDLTQEFFCRLFEKNYLADVRREKGKFRTFLLAAMKHFLANERVRSRRIKRGGGRTLLSLEDGQAEQRYLLDPENDLSPEKLYEQRWATTIMEQALTRLREKCERTGKSTQFQLLKNFLTTEPNDGDYAAIATRLKISPGAVGVAVHRLRHRYGELIRAEIAQTVAQPADIDDELRYLYAILTG
ncbi:MAG: sigma-70 family RNA polymerase sigma factor [Verrucomicrobia bacterium]|nr:sigma-70 family RNA polymerase sigma factor [Verrucomicrobiota bacterium]